MFISAPMAFQNESGIKTANIGIAITIIDIL